MVVILVLLVVVVLVIVIIVGENRPCIGKGLGFKSHRVHIYSCS